MRRNTANTAIAGEFYVLAELARRDAIASMTLRNTKGIDILVSPPRSKMAFKVEVKTSRTPTVRALTWHGSQQCVTWRMSKKHEKLRDRSLIFVFVWLPPVGCPRFFVVSSNEVARYVRWEHKRWLRVKKGKSGEMRMYRIPESKWSDSEGNWRLFKLPQ